MGNNISQFDGSAAFEVAPLGRLLFAGIWTIADPDPRPASAPHRGPMSSRPLTPEEEAHLAQMP